MAFRFQNDMQLQILQTMHGYIIFLDENNSFIKTHEFARIVNESDNYFVIICRDALPQLPYSIEEIYGMRTDKESQKYIEPRKTYNELYNIYNLHLIERTKDTVLHYNKARLNEAYLTDGNLGKIRAQLPEQIEV